jgi:hypothetical protein
MILLSYLYEIAGTQDRSTDKFQRPCIEGWYQAAGVVKEPFHHRGHREHRDEAKNAGEEN